MTFVDVQRAIQTRVAADPAIKTRQQRQEFWSRMMDDVGQKASDRLKASELLKRSQGDFIEQQDVGADVTYHVSWEPPAAR